MDGIDEIGKYRLQERARKLDTLRSRYIAEQDSVKYASLCLENGIEPEDQNLYEEGLAWLVHEEENKPPSTTDAKQQNTSSGSSDNDNARQFYNIAKNYNPRIGADTGMKERLMKQYFKKFQHGGSQDLSEYKNTSIGAVFNKLVNSYAKKFK